MEKKEKLSYTGRFNWGYYNDSDSGLHFVSFLETVKIGAESLEEAVKDIIREQSIFINQKQSKNRAYYIPGSVELLSPTGETVFKTNWKKFTVYCVEEVLDAFDDFEAYNPLPPVTLYAKTASDASDLAREILYGQVYE